MKLVSVIMGQNCEKFIEMAVDGVQESDAIVYIDGGSTDKTIEILRKKGFWENYDKPANPKHDKWIIRNNYKQEDKGMNGKQRNFYLSYIKKNYKDWWCLAIDADEVVEDLNKIKEFIQNAEPTLYSVKMRHLIGDLAHEDALQQTHFVLNRLFKIDKADKYPKVEHPVLNPKGCQPSATDCTTIWHLAYVPGMWDIKKRYDNHMKKSDIHTPDYLKSWYWAHLFGYYQKKQFDPIELPRIILDKFGVNKDELYFMNRAIETKHSLMVKQWNNLLRPESVLALGCGRGPYLFYWDWLVRCQGIEINEWAVKNSFLPDRTIKGDITKIEFGEWDLITAIDILEHLDYKELDKVIDKMVEASKQIIVSVPVIGDPNLDNDPTHLIKETKDWWINKFTSRGLKQIGTPNYFLFGEQILIFKNEKP